MFIHLAVSRSPPDICFLCTLGLARGAHLASKWLFWSQNRGQHLEGQSPACSSSPCSAPWPTTDEGTPGVSPGLALAPESRICGHSHQHRSLQITPIAAFFPCSSTSLPAEGFREIWVLYFAFPGPVSVSGGEGCSVLEFPTVVPTDVLDGDSCPAWDISWPLQLLVGLGQGQKWLWSTCITSRASQWALLSCSRAQMLPLLYK